MSRRWAGFTVLELLMVVTLLAILAVTLIPQFTAAHEDARRAVVHDDIEQFTRQLKLYREQHSGHWPAEKSTSEDTLLKQLKSRTTATGIVAADGKYGPYLIGPMPTNPFKGSSSVIVVNGPLASTHHDGHGPHGWAYSSTTGEFRANLKPHE